MIRQATAEDFEDIVALGADFTKESGLPLTYNEEHARATIWHLIHNPAADFLVAVEDGALLGVVILVYEHNYYDETVAYVDKLFVHKELRGLGVSRELLAAVDKVCRARGASLIFASATAAMGPRIEKLYVRLFEKYGFNVLGRIIMKDLK